MMSRCPVNCECGRHSLETREKLSLVGKGRGFTEEHRQRIGDGNRGKVHSDEQNRRQSEARKGVLLGPHTEEARKRHSEAANLNVKTHFKVGNVPYMKGRTKETDPTARGISEKQLANYAAGQVSVSGQPGFFASDLGHRVRSGWEANLCRLFDFSAVEYQYEPRPFTLLSGETYLPDFYLPKFDIFIELKGNYRGKSSTEKAERFGSEYGINLTIIDKPRYLELEQRWRDIVPNWNVRK